MKNYTFKIQGMSCSHCERAVQESIKNISGVKKISVSAAKGNAVVSGAGISVDAIYSAVKEAGYSVTDHEESDVSEDDRRKKIYSMILQIIIGIGIALTVVIIMTSDVFNEFLPVIPNEASYGLLFLAGMLTSLHCVAMCGGINISQCMNNNNFGKYSKIIPSLLYNSGRLTSYTVIGGILGFAGSVFNFSNEIKSAIMLVAGLFMVFLGLKMIGILNIFRYIPIKVPELINVSKMTSSFKYGPYVVGLLNGLMPCGPLQTMQLYAFGTGDVVSGAMSMFIFSLGTIPLMFSLGTISTILSRRFAMKAFKVGGVIVIVLGLIMISNSTSLSGFSIFEKKGDNAALAKIEGNNQTVISSMDSNNYQPIIVKKGIPVKWIIQVKEENLNSCNNAIIIPEYNIEKKLQPGDNEIIFTADKTGTIQFTCWMGMISSSIIVVDDLSKADKSSVTPANNRGKGCCGGSVK